MLVSIYYKPSLFYAHTMILIVHIFMTVNKLCLNHMQEEIALGYSSDVNVREEISLGYSFDVYMREETALGYSFDVYVREEIAFLYPGRLFPKMSASRSERRDSERFYKKLTISELQTTVPKVSETVVNCLSKPLICLYPLTLYGPISWW